MSQQRITCGAMRAVSDYREYYYRRKETERGAKKKSRVQKQKVIQDRLLIVKRTAVIRRMDVRIILIAKYTHALLLPESGDVA